MAFGIPNSKDKNKMIEQTKHVALAVTNYSGEVFVQEDSDNHNE